MEIYISISSIKEDKAVQTKAEKKY